MHDGETEFFVDTKLAARAARVREDADADPELISNDLVGVTARLDAEAS